MPISEKYGEHVVAFVDILGFAELVGQMDRQRTLIDEIYMVQSTLHTEELTVGFGDWLREGLARLTIASDSFFYSVSLERWARSGRGDEGRACLSALESVFWLQRYLLKRGILTRGGVARGSLLHEQGLIFGPSLVAAYRLESQVALYPRVVVAKDVLATIANSKFDGPIPLPERLATIVRRDADGLFFVDYLHFDMMSIETDLSDLFSNIRAFLITKLEASRGDVRIFQKIAWLVTYYNASLTRLRALGSDHFSPTIEFIEMSG